VTAEPALDIPALLDRAGVDEVTSRTSCVELREFVTRIASGLHGASSVDVAAVRDVLCDALKPRGVAEAIARDVADGLDGARRWWVVAWHRLKAEGVLRQKAAEGLAEWRARRWDFFAPHEPHITDVTAQVLSLLHQLDAPELTEVAFEPEGTGGRLLATRSPVVAPLISLTASIEREVLNRRLLPHRRFGCDEPNARAEPSATRARAGRPVRSWGAR